MEKVNKFDLEAAFKALDEIEQPKLDKGEGKLKANRVDLRERFSQKPGMDKLVEDYYDLTSGEDLEEAQDDREAEVAQAKLARIEKIVDLDAESPDDLLPSYVGKVIMQCPQCMTLFYKNPEDIEHSEENPDVVNINEICQHCGNSSGYTLIGKVGAVGEDEMDNYQAAEEAPAEENELDLNFEEPTEEVDAEGTGEADTGDNEADNGEGNEDLDLDLDLDLGEEEEEKKEESLHHSEAERDAEKGSELFTDNKSDKLTLNEDANDSLDDDSSPITENDIKYLNTEAPGLDDEKDGRLLHELNLNDALIAAKQWYDANDGDAFWAKVVAALEDKLNYTDGSAFIKSFELANGKLVINTEKDLIKNLDTNSYRIVLADYNDNNGVDQEDVEYLLKPGQTKGDLVKALSNGGFISVYVHDGRPATEDEIKQEGSLGFETVKGSLGDDPQNYGNADDFEESLNNSEAQADAEKKSELKTENDSENLTLNEAHNSLKESAPVKATEWTIQYYNGKKEKTTDFEAAFEKAEDMTEIQNIWAENGDYPYWTEEEGLFDLDVDSGEVKSEFTESLNNSKVQKDAEKGSELKTENESENLALNEDASDEIDAIIASWGTNESLEEDSDAKGLGKLKEKGDLDRLLDSEEFQTPVSEKEIEAARKLAQEGEKEEEKPVEEELDFDVDDLDECSLNKHVDEYLKEVYSNVKSYETTDCALREGKLFVEGKITFNSGKCKPTTFEFSPVSADGKLFFEGVNKDFSEDKAFKLNCSINESKTLITESLGYSYKINEALVEGLK